MNGYFSSFQRTIMSESIFFTVTVLAVAFWIDYLRTGQTVFLALLGLSIGLLIGIRPAGILLVPMLAASVRLKWHKRDVSAPLLAAALMLPVMIGPVLEQLLYRAKHGEHRDLVLAPILLGKQLSTTYVPVHEFLARLPSRAAFPVMIAGYESAAQFAAFGRDMELISLRSGVSGGVLAYELGKQSILANFPGYLRLSLLHYLGQWSIMALKLPPTAHAMNSFVASYPKVPLDGVLGDAFLRPTASLQAYVVYPVFLGAGMITFVLGIALIVFIVRPALGDEMPGQYLMLAAFFAATCHSYTLLISFINVSTPRFLMAVYPQLVMVVIFLVSAFLCRSSSARRVATGRAKS